MWGSVAALCTFAGCSKMLETISLPEDSGPEASVPGVTVEEMARLLSELPIGREQVREVHDAVSASAGNGYDEEYTLRDLIATPGAGVGDAASKAEPRTYQRPLRDLLREALAATRAGADEWLDSLSGTDLQIYWPYSASWDGEGLPVVTFDPGDFAVENVGYALQADGSVAEVTVNEAMAASRPVWVVNRNSDADFTSLELLRRQDPSWGNGGGDILVRSGAGGKDFKTLILRSFRANRQFDSWFCGASEFFVKVGAVEDFWASTEAELRLYQPSVTDFMIVVRRDQVEQDLPFNAVLVSEWTGQLSNCAFMVIEDDGGTRTTWKCSAVVKYSSKNYGFELEIPLNSRDDIVWRGALTSNYIERYSGSTGHFGDVDLVLDFICPEPASTHSPLSRNEGSLSLQSRPCK